MKFEIVLDADNEYSRYLYFKTEKDFYNFFEQQNREQHTFTDTSSGKTFDVQRYSIKILRD